MSKYLLGGAVAAAMVAIAPALAQTPAPAPVKPQVQDRLGEPGWQGRERSSIQTRAEVAAHMQTMFARLDTNRDGSITKAETEAAKASRGDRRAEHAGKRSGAMFERLDTNRDGSVTRAEFDAAHAQRKQRIASRDKDGDGRPDARGMRGGKGKGMRMGMGGLHGRMFEMSDANRDGRVTLQEATNAALRHFDTADVNRDGRLTPEERMQMHQRMRGAKHSG